MSKEDIEKAVKDAEQYAAEDAKIKEKVEVRNQADQMVYQSEKTLGEVGDKIPADEKAKVQSGIDKLKEVLKGDDTDAIKSATEELTQMFYQMSEKLYQQANPQGGAQAVLTWAARTAARRPASSRTARQASVVAASISARQTDCGAPQSAAWVQNSSVRQSA